MSSMFKESRMSWVKIGKQTRITIISWCLSIISQVAGSSQTSKLNFLTEIEFMSILLKTDFGSDTCGRIIVPIFEHSYFYSYSNFSDSLDELAD